MTTPTALSIGATDPSGGAGVISDMQVFADHGVYGTAVVTAITVQNTTRFTLRHDLDLELVRDQIRAVCEDMPPDVVRIGLVPSVGCARVIVDALQGLRCPVVLDPVLTASLGAKLGELEAIRVLSPRATVITPNALEARQLLGDAPPGVWAKDSGVALLLTDGHGDGQEVIDRLFLADGGTEIWRHPRLDAAAMHGTGCSVAASLAARLARGETMIDACRGAIRYTVGLIERAMNDPLGRGASVLPHGTDPPA